MRFVLEIECDNDAFADDCLRELAAILSALPDALLSIDADEPYLRSVEGTLRDTNGNSVGTWRLGT